MCWKSVTENQEKIRNEQPGAGLPFLGAKPKVAVTAKLRPSMRSGVSPQLVAVAGSVQNKLNEGIVKEYLLNRDKAFTFPT
jgi:hypothetical protein